MDVLTDLENRLRIVSTGPAETQLADGAVRSKRRFASVFEAFLVWLVLFVVIAGSRGVGAGLLHSTLLAGLWVFTARALRHQLSHIEVVANGVVLGIVSGGGATLLLMAVSTVWDVGAAEIAIVGTAVFAVTALWSWAVARSSANDRTVLIVGGWADGIGDLLAELRAETRSRFIPIGVIAEDVGELSFGDTPVLGVVSDLRQVVHRLRPDLIVVGVQRNRPEVFAELLEVAGAGFRVVGLPEFYEHVFGRLPIRQLTAAWFMSVLHLYQRPYSVVAKRAFDIVAALGILLLFAPLFPFIYLLIALTPGDVIYRQTRIGAHGKPFTIFKFRTMTQQAEQNGVPLWAVKQDARVTPVGRVLRRSRLDELPQIFNVLRGEMSIVGPRPERPEFVAMLEAEVPFWSRRHLIKPGITGWAQIRGGYASDMLETEEKLAYDLWYLRHCSLLVDAVICLLTLPRLLSGQGAR